MAVKLKVVHTSSGIRNVFARMPFRFGVITMRAAPLLTLAVEIEDAAGRRATGYAADFLAYRWFDKRPEKSLADNCRDLIRPASTRREISTSRPAARAATRPSRSGARPCRRSSAARSRATSTGSARRSAHRCSSAA